MTVGPATDRRRDQRVHRGVHHLGILIFMITMIMISVIIGVFNDSMGDILS